MLAFAGRLEAHAIGAMWRPAIHAAEHARGRTLSFDLRNVTVLRRWRRIAAGCDRDKRMAGRPKRRALRRVRNGTA